MKKNLAAILTLAVFTAGADLALAANLTAPFDLENTAVLPSGVRNPRIKDIFIRLEDKWTDDGTQEPLGAALNKRVTWKDIVDSQKTQEDKNLVSGSVSALGMDSTDTPGSTTGEVNTAIDVKVPVFAMGVTPRLTLALAVPVYTVDVSAATGFVKTQGGQNFVTGVCDSDPVKCNEAKRKLDDAVNQKLTRLGYEPIRSRHISALGDVKLVGKYRTDLDSRTSIVIKPAITAPTGVAPDVNRALDVPTGDGQWDGGATLVAAYQAFPWLEISGFGGYTVQFPDTIERRIPASKDDRLSDDREVVDRDLGDQVNAGWGLTVGDTRKGLSFGFGYSYQHMNRVGYSGSRYSAARYSFLESFDQPEQSLHSATVSAGFATIDWFKEGKFVYPFQAQLAYSRPLSGRNVGTADVISAELVLFF